MPEARINVPLSGGEITALIRMAEMDCRQPREQLRFLLREEACKRGLLTSEQQAAAEREGQGLGVSRVDRLRCTAPALMGGSSETPHKLSNDRSSP